MEINGDIASLPEEIKADSFLGVQELQKFRSSDNSFSEEIKGDKWRYRFAPWGDKGQ